MKDSERLWIEFLLLAILVSVTHGWVTVLWFVTAILTYVNYWASRYLERHPRRGRYRP